MNESYVECLVKGKGSLLAKLGKFLLLAITVFAVLLMLVTNNVLTLVLAVASGAGVYFLNLYAEVEYEYLYLDKELTVDKVMNRTKRKKAAVYEVGKIEVLAPIKSYHLDDYRNRTCKTVDYSIGREEQPDLRYVMYYDGKERVILSPSPELIKVIRNVSPRKVFED